MTIVLAIVAAVCLVILIFVLLQNRKLELTAATANQEAERHRQHYEAETSRAQTEAQQEADRQRQHYEGETARVYSEAQAAVAEAQKLIDQQIAGLKQESERVRQHYEAEARKVQEAADALVAKNLAEVESLRKYETLRDAEAEAQRELAEAIKEATALREHAEALMAQAREAAAQERSQAVEKAKGLRDQADALLDQATRDAGRIMAEAEKRAEQIGGDAYRALREKELLEHAAEAMRNVVEDYGDRYLIPTHSLLDDLAAEFGYAAAGESLKSAIGLSRRMVEQGQAATCDYAEANRRKIAISFVIFAFNGLVASILAGVKSDNYGTLEQKIRDSFSLVNVNGQAFRNARIMPAYLDARLAELKWGVVVQEMARQRQDEQRVLREEMRDREKARREDERRIQEAKKEEEMKRMAREEVLNEHERAVAELRAKLQKASEEQRAELEKAIEENEVKFKSQLQEKDEQVRLAKEESQRAISNAEKGIKHGHVYIISNIGSFNREDVFKIGLTRRDDWQERVDELGDASVPFKFDVHGIIESDNAPALERKLHTRFMAQQVNKRSSYNEFFRVSLTEIFEEIQKLKQGEDFTVKRWTTSADATLWHESQKIDNDPQELEKWLSRERAKARRSPALDAVSSFDEV